MKTIITIKDEVDDATTESTVDVKPPVPAKPPKKKFELTPFYGNTNSSWRHTHPKSVVTYAELGIPKPVDKKDPSIKPTASKDEDSDSEKELARLNLEEEEREAFDVDRYKPGRIKHVTVPWMCQPAKFPNVETQTLFRDAIDHFSLISINNEVNHFIRIVDSLIPSLPGLLNHCHSLDKLDPSKPKFPVVPRLIEWICYGIDAERRLYPNPMAVFQLSSRIIRSLLSSDSPMHSQLTDNVLVTIGDTSISTSLIDSIVHCCVHTGFTDNSAETLGLLLKMLQHPSLWRSTNEQLRDWGCGSDGETAYAVLFGHLLKNQDNSIHLKFVRLMSLISSWSGFLEQCCQLEKAAAVVRDAPKTARMDKLNDLFNQWHSFESSFSTVRSVIIDIADDKICALSDIYFPLEQCKVLKTVVVLLDLMRKCPALDTASPLKWMGQIADDRYYGMLLLARFSDIHYLLKLLKKIDKKEKKEEGTPPRGFEEGLAPPSSYPSVGCLRDNLCYRLATLELCDAIKSADPTRLSIESWQLSRKADHQKALEGLLKLMTTRKGERQVSWMLSQKYVIYLLESIQTQSTLEEESIIMCNSVLILNSVVEHSESLRLFDRYLPSIGKLMTEQIDDMASDTRSMAPLLHSLTNKIFQMEKGPARIYRLVSGISAEESQKGTSAYLTLLVRTLESALVDGDGSMRYDVMTALMESRCDAIGALTAVLCSSTVRQHSLWQMGEPLSSAPSRLFLRLAFPLLRLLTRISICLSTLPSNDDESEVSLLDETMSSSVLRLWSLTSGFNGQGITDDVIPLRRLVLDWLGAVSCSKSSLLSSLISVADSLIYLRPAFISLLIALLPPPAPLLVTRAHQSTSETVRSAHQQAVSDWQVAMTSLDSEKANQLAEILICPVPYVLDLSSAFCRRVCQLGDVMTIWLVRSLLLSVSYHFIIPSDDIIPEMADISDDDVDTARGGVKKEPAPAPSPPTKASSGQVRQLAWLLNLLDDTSLRAALAHFIANSPVSSISLAPLFKYFESPWNGSERQLSCQENVLELLETVLDVVPWSLSAASVPPVSAPPSSSTVEKDSIKKEEAPVERESESPAANLSVPVIPADGTTDDPNVLFLILSSVCRVISWPDAIHSPSLIGRSLRLIHRELKRGGASAAMAFHCLCSSGGVLRLLSRATQNRQFDQLIFRPLIALLHAIVEYSGLAVVCHLVGFPSDKLSFEYLGKFAVNRMARSADQPATIVDFFHLFNQVQTHLAATTTSQINSGPFPQPAVFPVALIPSGCPDDITVVDTNWMLMRQTRLNASLRIQCRVRDGIRMGSDVSRLIESHTGRGRLIRSLMEHYRPSDEDTTQGDSSQPPAKRTRLP